MRLPQWEALSRTLRRQEADLRLRLAAAEREQRRLEEQRRLQAKVEARLLAQQREAEGPPLPEAHQPPTQVCATLCCPGAGSLCHFAPCLFPEFRMQWASHSI